MKKFVLLLLSGLIIFSTLPATGIQASNWQSKYIMRNLKVKVKKPITVYKVKFGKYTYQNKYVKKFKLKKGAIVKTNYADAGGFHWPMHSKKYKWTSKYGYDALWKKGSFKVLSSNKIH